MRHNARAVLVLIGAALALSACTHFYPGPYPPPDIGTRANATRWPGLQSSNQANGLAGAAACFASATSRAASAPRTLAMSS